MSKTVDDLMVVYDLAFGDAVNATESWDQAIGHRAAIAAVAEWLDATGYDDYGHWTGLIRAQLEQPK